MWEGPPATDPTPSLPLALELGRIEVLGDRYVIVDPGITLDRFGWEEDAAEGMTLRKPDGTVIPLGDANAEEDEP